MVFAFCLLPALVPCISKASFHAAALSCPVASFLPLTPQPPSLSSGILLSIVTDSLNYALTYKKSASRIYLNVYPQMNGLKLWPGENRKTVCRSAFIEYAVLSFPAVQANSDHHIWQHMTQTQHRKTNTVWFPLCVWSKELNSQTLRALGLAVGYQTVTRRNVETLGGEVQRYSWVGMISSDALGCNRVAIAQCLLFQNN